MNIGRGITGPPAVPDFEEKDSNAAGFIKNKPNMEDYLKISGGRMEGRLDMANQKLENIPTPEMDGDAANKGYVQERFDEGKAYTDKKYDSKKVTLRAAKWNDGRQTVAVVGVTADESKTDVFAAPTAMDHNNRTVFADCGVYLAEQLNGAVVFGCVDVPGCDLDVNVAVIIKAAPAQEGISLTLSDGVLTIG